MRPPTVLVSGASGFVGGAVVARLAVDGLRVRAAARRPGVKVLGAEATIAGVELAAGTDWCAALAGVHAVVHCAARVHVLHKKAAEPLVAFRAVNVDGTLALARQAVAAGVRRPASGVRRPASGVRRFVFISSIGVNGADTFGRAFRSSDPSARLTLPMRSQRGKPKTPCDASRPAPAWP